MSSKDVISLRSFPLIKIISSLLFIIGAVLAYIFSSQPELMLMQIGGVQLSLILGIFPLLSGIVLLIYAFLTNYDTEISMEDARIKIKSKKEEVSIQKDEIQAVRVRDAGKFFIWFVFFFVNFYFVYYGIEAGLYFAANHYAGSFEYILYALFVVWLGGLILVLFPRKLVIILTKDKAIVQKVNQLPKDGSFQTMFDDILGFKKQETPRLIKNNHIFLRLIFSFIFGFIFIFTSMLVEVDGISQPIHDLGIFIPIFLLLFTVLMISTTINGTYKQRVDISNNFIRIEETSLNTSIKGKSLCWLKAKEEITDRNFIRGFRKLTKFELLLIFVISGQAIFLAFRFLWLPSVYLTYIDWMDILIGVIMLIALFLYQFEIVDKLEFELDSELSLVREIFVPNHNKLGKDEKKREKTVSFSQGAKNYFKEFRGLLKTDKKHILKVCITYVASIGIITLTFTLLGFVIFLFI